MHGIAGNDIAQLLNSYHILTKFLMLRCPVELLPPSHSCVSKLWDSSVADENWIHYLVITQYCIVHPFPCPIPCHRCEKSARESRNVTTSTREPTTCAWIRADVCRQGGAICSKNRKIVSYHGCVRIPRLTVSVPDYGSCSLDLINRAGGLYGRILTSVVCTDLTAFGLYSRPRSRFSHTHLLLG